MEKVLERSCAWTVARPGANSIVMGSVVPRLQSGLGWHQPDEALPALDSNFENDEKYNFISIKLSGFDLTIALRMLCPSNFFAVGRFFC